MTTLQTVEVICASCGTRSEQTLIGSTNAMGSADLDLRPPEMKRSTMPWWLQECPSCGSVASDLSENENGLKQIVESKAFRLIDGTDLSRRFMRRSYIDTELGNTDMAATEALWAAWASDDEGDEAAAIRSRIRSASLFQVAAQSDGLTPEGQLLLLVRTLDVLRRAKQFDDAVKLADALQGRGDDFIARVVAFGRSLAVSQDASARTVAEADEAGSPK
jgi:hypothetical protein